MSQSDETSTPRTQPSAASGLPALEIGRRVLEQWTRGTFAYGHELSLFAMARFNREFETWRALATCRSAEEIIQCQQDFAQKATADYAAEVGKLLQLTIDAAGEAFTMGEQG